MAELSKSDKGDDADTVKLSELFYGRHFRGKYDTSGIILWISKYNHSLFLLCPQLPLPLLVLLCLILFLGFPKVLCYSRVPFAVVFIGSTLFALQQLSGINAVFYFSSTVFKSAGVPSNLANVFIGIANLTGSFSSW